MFRVSFFGPVSVHCLFFSRPPCQVFLVGMFYLLHSAFVLRIVVLLHVGSFLLVMFQFCFAFCCLSVCSFPWLRVWCCCFWRRSLLLLYLSCLFRPFFFFKRFCFPVGFYCWGVFLVWFCCFVLGPCFCRRHHFFRYCFHFLSELSGWWFLWSSCSCFFVVSPSSSSSASASVAVSVKLLPCSALSWFPVFCACFCCLSLLVAVLLLHLLAAFLLFFGLDWLSFLYILLTFPPRIDARVLVITSLLHFLYFPLCIMRWR